MRPHVLLTVLLLVLAAAAGGGIWLQRQETAVLRREKAFLQEESRALEKLRVENARLKAEQPTAAELERLRADHAAIVRLRAEVDAMKRRAEARSR